MDTLMDKLSQKLNAQEMIRANGAAENEAMNLLKTQVREYQGCLDRMQQVCSDLSALETQIAENSSSKNELDGAVIEEMKQQLEDLTHKSNEQLSQLQKDLVEKLGSGDELHKECVRVYRNVQAVVQEESGKQAAAVEESVRTIFDEEVKPVNVKVTCAMVFSIVAAVMSIAGFAFQMLSFLGVI